MIKRLTIAVTVAVAYATAPTAIAAAQTGGCEYDFFEQRQVCLISVPPAPNVTRTVGEGAVSFRWVRTYAGTGSFGSLPEMPMYCVREVAGPDGTLTRELGNIYWVAMFNAATGEAVIPAHDVCQFPGDPVPTPPPPPPTVGEFVEGAADLLRVEPAVNPNAAWGGITGLETWLWCTDPGEVATSVSLRGWTAEATMRPVAFSWAIAGPEATTLSADQCGTEAAPGATWMPEVLGDYELALSATWAGTWSLAYQGIPAGTFPLGPVDIAGPATPYPVGEYVGVLTNGGGS